jgi:type I restriction enzyme, S subunit
MIESLRPYPNYRDSRLPWLGKIPEHWEMRRNGRFPSPDEQAAIVRILDYFDRSIRRYIAAKRRLISLLNEQKQAIIHRAVTRGLDPNVRLKPSGVEWLGEVPEHWELAPVRLRYDQCLGKMVDAKRFTGDYAIP